MGDERINLTVQVNAQTGQLEVLGAKFDQVSDKAKHASDSFSGLTGESGNLLKSFLPFATAGGIIAFFSSAVKGAEDENEAMRRLKFVVESTGSSWDANRESITKWMHGIQDATRFSDSEALQTLERLARATGSLTQGQKASKLAMDLSVQTGQSLASTTEIVNGLIVGQSRAVLMATKEFGSLVGGATTAQGVLDALGKKVEGASEREESLTKTQSQTSHAFEDFAKQIGQTILPGVQMLTAGLTGIIKVIDTVGTSVAGVAATIFHLIEGLVKDVVAVVTGHWKQLAAINAETMAKLDNDNKETIASINKTWNLGQQEQTDTLLKGTNDRLVISAAALAKQEQEDRQAQNERLQKYHENEQKLIAIEASLDKEIAGMHQQGLQREQAVLAADIAQKKAAIDKEIKGEREKQAALAKLREYEHAATAQLAVQQTKIKQEYALNTMQLAVETLQTLNSLGDKGSAADVARAKALLLLQQSIAIGWAVVASTKATAETGNPAVGAALLAAQLSLIAVQTAAGFQQIDKAAAQQQAGSQGVSINAPVPGIDLPPPTSSSPSAPNGSGNIGSSNAAGGGAPTQHNVVFNGDVIINGVNDASKIPDHVVDAIGEKIIEGIKARGQLSFTGGS